MITSKTEETIKKWEAIAISHGVYGFGLSKLAAFCLPLFGERIKLKGIFDNNRELHRTIQNGIPILSPTEINKEHKIIVFAADYSGIKSQLEKLGLQEFQDFINAHFFIIHYNRSKKRAVLPFLHLSLTTKCTLACKDCNFLMPEHRPPFDVSLTEAKNDLAMFFNAVDFVAMVSVLGGEPLLYRDLALYLRDISRYQDKIGKVIIITNGTLLPNAEVLEICAQDGIEFQISDYSDCGIKNNQQQALIELLAKNKVSYTVNRGAWNLFPCRDETFSKMSDTEMANHYDRCYFACSRNFPGLNAGKFYPCHLSWSAARCGICAETTDDYVDLSGELSEVREKIMQMGAGILPKGYVALCRHCYGGDPQHLIAVPKAEQR